MDTVLYVAPDGKIAYVTARPETHAHIEAQSRENARRYLEARGYKLGSKA